MSGNEGLAKALSRKTIVLGNEGVERRAKNSEEWNVKID